MKNWMYRGMSMVLAVLMICSLFTISVFADENETAPENSGFTIDTETELYKALDEAAKGLSARQILVYDSTNDQLIYTKSVDGGKLYPASVTKLFTCYVALQILDPSKVVTAGSELNLVAEDSSMAYIYRNQQVTVKMLVGGMMMPSGNDAAMIMAAAAGRKLAGDSKLPAEEAVRTFVAEMNRQAKELGFEKTHFTNCIGLYDPDLHCTVEEMAIILKAALENDFCREVLTTITYQSVPTDHHPEGQVLSNLFSRRIQYQDTGSVTVSAAKTGYVEESGFCAASYGTTADGREYLCVTGKSTGTQQSIKDHAELYRTYCPKAEVVTTETA